MRTYKIKCYKCGKTYIGKNKDNLITENNLKMKGKYYYCDCIKSIKKQKKGFKFDSV